MSDKSGIEWTDATWSPTTGCDRVSAGCDNCYALTMAARLKAMGSAKYQRDGDPRTSGPGFGLTVHEDVLSLPFKWRKPKRIFVNSMSDLFHDQVPDAFLDEVFGVMAVAHALYGHTFQVLTKRHGRMRSYLNSSHRLPGTRRAIANAAHRWAIDRINAGWLSEAIEHGHAWPLPGVWLGVSVEDQKWADIRIDALRETPAALRMLSLEPLLGPIDALDLTGIGWVIVGGESGPGARPMRIEWAEALVRQCQSAGVAAFVKQLGSRWARENGADSKGGSWDLWPAALRVREYPEVANANA